jgi:hypothetical protein
MLLEGKCIGKLPFGKPRRRWDGVDNLLLLNGYYIYHLL